VIAGAAIGRDLALYGADVLNVWRPNDTEMEGFFWTVQVGTRSTILDSSPRDRATFDHLLKDADVFFANKRPGFLKLHGLDAEELCAKKPGLIHAPWFFMAKPVLGRTDLDSMRSVRPCLNCLRSNARSHDPSSHPSFPFATTLWAGWVPSVSSRLFAGAPSREEVIGSLYP
jgi:hypothetical protein